MQERKKWEEQRKMEEDIEGNEGNRAGSSVNMCVFYFPFQCLSAE
jgi:hypothetical protein